MKSKLVAIALASVFILSGCSLSSPPEQRGGIDVEKAENGITDFVSSGYVELPDGRSVLCVAIESKGISCDWDSAD